MDQYKNENTDKKFVYSAVKQAEHNEVLEMNYLQNTYKVIYRGKQLYDDQKTEGRISEAVWHTAHQQVHPDDRKRFYQFWQLDCIGISGVADEMQSVRHSEFRKRNEDGSYGWVEQVLIPIRKSGQESIIVMTFYNKLDEAEAQDHDRDEATGHILYNRQEFFQYADKMLKQSVDETKWCLVAIDIEKFKLFNEWYGVENGDKLLRGIAECLDELQREINGLAGCFGEDDFVILMHDDKNELRRLEDVLSLQIKEHSGKMNVLPAFGVYEIHDKNEQVFRMYDRAKLACTAVKNNYTTRIKKFDLKMLEALESELLLLADIQNAFENKEFTFALQPKCNMKNGKIVGAEALARWKSREKGEVSPGAFIPFLEKTGLISELDTFVWEEVCKWQRYMLDRGHDTVPVSVNVSRIDICSIDVPSYFEKLIRKYDLDPKLIEIEITESAYAEDSDVINSIVDKLRTLGFNVLMDDFGSAYSSLNMLKDISIDIIKIDMRFLQWNGENASKAIDILETVCNMANILGIGIVAEGIETEEQKTFLLEAGCSCGQGYYYYRPLSITDFEKEIENADDMESEYQVGVPTELFNLPDLLNKNILSRNMLHNMLGAMAFYDVYDKQISVVRYNKQYSEVLGDDEHQTETSINFGEQLYEEDYEKIFQMFADAQKNRQAGASGNIRRRRTDGTDMWLHLKVFFLYQRDGHSIYYSTVEDVTEINKSNMILQFFNNDMPGGYYRHKNNEDAEFTHISQRFLDMFGFTREEIKEQFDDKLINMVHPEDRDAMRYGMSAMGQTGGNYYLPCRMRSSNGYIFVMDYCRLVKFGGQEIYQGIVLSNLDNEMWLKDDNSVSKGLDMAMTLMPCGVFRAEADGKHRFSYISNSMLQMLGYSREDFEKKFKNCTENMVYIGDRERINREIEEQISFSNYTATEYRIELADGSLKWVYSRGRLTTDANGKRWFYVCITDYSYLKHKYEIQEWQHLKYQSLSEIPGVLVYDYDPQSDILTMEIATEKGKEVVVAEKYLTDIEKYEMVAEEDRDEQKMRMVEACERPLNGVTEFRGHFLKGEELQWYRFHYISLADEKGKVYRIVGHGDNITEEKSRESVLKHKVMRDSLTGLFNFESSKDLIQMTLAEQHAGVLILMDVDNFKEVNDTLGHLAGDVLLKNVAEMLRSSFDNDGDVLVRFGGDEFMVFIPGEVSRDRVLMKVQKFLDKINRIPMAEGINAQCSIGITFANEQAVPFDTLFEQADEALYVSKQNGKNQYTFYEK